MTSAPSIDRDQILQAYPLEEVMQQGGVEFTRIQGRLMCKCPFHADGTPSLSVDLEKGLWKCFGCNKGGTSIDFIAFSTGEDSKAVYRRLATELTGASPAPRKQLQPKASPVDAPKEEKVKDSWPVPGKDTPVAVYPYVTLFGQMTYEVCRFERPNPTKPSGYDKTFRQRHRGEAGSWVWNMDGVERVLFRLPEVAASGVVWLAEGEKDALNLTKIGLCGTCNVGGAGKWMDGYTDSLAGKDVAICGDNDEPGKKHVELVFDSICKRAKSVRIIRLPEAYKDASDYIASWKTPEEAKTALDDLFHSATPFVQGSKLALFSFVELETRYKSYISKIAESSLSLSSWIPALSPLRRLVPGDLVTFLAGTGVGKTSILANIAIHAKPLPTLFFELELPDQSMFERFVGIKCNFSGRQVEEGYKVQDEVGPEALHRHFGHIAISTESSMTTMDLESTIIRSELKTGVKPKLVLLDYIQLMKGPGKSRYEQRSSVAEELKIVAKTTQTIIILSSQIGRKGQDDSPEVHMSDGKESGSIENSSGVVIGVWRDPEDPSLMTMRVLKATKGGAGLEVPCTYDLHSLKITQRSSAQNSTPHND